MNSKIQKIKNYYNENGFQETLKKLYRYALFRKRYQSSNVVYRLSKKEKQKIVSKSKKKIYVFACMPYFDISKCQRSAQLAKTFNSMGFLVEYYYAFDSHKSSKDSVLLPVVIHQQVCKINKKNFTKKINSNDIFIFEAPLKAFLPYLELATQKECTIVYENLDNYKTLTDFSENTLKQFLEKSKILTGKSEVLVKQLEDYLSKYKIVDKSILYLPDAIDCNLLEQIKETKITKDAFIPTNNWYSHCSTLIDNIWSEKKCIPDFYDNISIIILNYNNKNVIENCIDSILYFNQRYHVEIIVIDNQSTDGSYELLLEKYSNKIKLYRNSRNGCSSGRNLGVKNASKKYIMFLDSDQWVLHPYWLDTYIEILAENSKIGALGWAAGWFNKNGYAYHIVDSFPYKYMPPIGLYRSDIGYLGTGGMILKKELFNQIGGFDLFYDPTCYEDTDLSLSIRNKGFELAYTTYLGIEHLPHQTTNSGSDAHNNLIKSKGDYFVSKWEKINPKLLKYIK